MIPFLLIVIALIAIAVAGLSIGILIRGKFPDTHIEHNAEMKKLGITCAKNDGNTCQKRTDSAACRACMAAK